MKTINGYNFIEYSRPSCTEEQVIQQSKSFLKVMDERRTVREFSNKAILKEVIDNIILAASTAPSGAHKQPWTFCVVSDASIKSQIRSAAEKEEYENYHGRMSEEWLEDLKPFQTDWKKEFLETAPYLIIVFKKAYDISANGEKKNNYYVSESVGIACGFLLATIHHAGLVALTHTPSPMNFLSKILKRPENERPFLLIPVGYPSDGMYVPKLKRKELNEISVYY
jgi:iodotyrosine deiodinase